MSQALRDARRYEEAHEEMIPPEERPAFHLSARVGWMNDPNGFCRYQGKYHMFYQYHPYDSHWGPMHWGHAVSADLLHWEYLPAAMAPDRLFDRDGVYSGSAIELPDGKLLLMYTGVSRDMADGWEGRQIQTQDIAIGDGVDFEKYEGNPVITAVSLPAGGSRYDFRDPKIWREEDGTYRALMANYQEGVGGRMLLYRSRDAVHWEFGKVFAENDNRIGRMWECPDFFVLDGKAVLLGSAQDMLPHGFEYHNGNGAFYLTGTYDRETETFTEKNNHAADYGIDFYAPQTVLTPDGRRVMIGWMQNWDTCNLHTKSTPWFGQMSVPRELHVREDGVLLQKPVRELNALHTGEVLWRDVPVTNEKLTLPGVKGRMVDMTVTIEPMEGEELYSRFQIHFAENEDYHTTVSFRPHESTLKIDRKFSGSRRAIIHQRRAKVAHGNGRLTLRIILDRFSAEIFVGDGATVMSATLYTDQAADGISFFAYGKAKISVTKYDIKM